MITSRHQKNMVASTRRKPSGQIQAGPPWNHTTAPEVSTPAAIAPTMGQGLGSTR